MKRLLSVALIISLLAMFPWVTPAVAEDAPQTVLPSDEVMPWENNSDNVYNKIHVYLGDEDYATIDSAEELEAAVEQIKKTGSVFGIRVHFISFVYDPGSYPRLFKNLPYTEITHNNYAPEVYIKVKAENITASALEGLAKNDMIAWITSDSRIIPDFVPSNGNVSFADVPQGAWHYEHVKNAYSMGLMEGTSETTFEPNATLTRAMLVTIIGRFNERINGTLPESTEFAFSDVKSGKWYSDHVAWAAENGVVEGYPDGTFRPDAPVTREEAVTILGRYYDKTAPRDQSVQPWEQYYYPHTDTAEISDWAEKWVRLGMSLGAVHFEMGTVDADPESAPEYYFRPNDTMTRAEAAKVAFIFLSDIELSIERGNRSYKYDGLIPVE